MYKCLNGLAPQYLIQLVNVYEPPRPLRLKRKVEEEVKKLGLEKEDAHLLDCHQVCKWPKLQRLDPCASAKTQCSYETAFLLKFKIVTMLIVLSIF